MRRFPSRSWTHCRIRQLLALAVGESERRVAALPASTSLFGGVIALDSLAALELLSAVREEFDVDIAGEDLALDSLTSIGSLSDFVWSHVQDAAKRPSV